MATPERPPDFPPERLADTRPVRPVVQHTLLELRGGAARVAGLLAHGLTRLGRASRRVFEVPETFTGQSRLAAEPWREGLLGAMTQGEILHVHSTADWVELLGLLAGRSGRSGQAGRVVLTLHDMSLLTGGCAYAMDCAGFGQGCVDPCPRGFPESAAQRRLQAQALAGLSPLLVTPSRWLKGLAEAALPGASVTVIPNGVEWPSETFSRREAKKALGLAPEARLALFVAHGGSQAAYKHGGAWLDIWRGIKARVPAAVGFFVGGQEQSRLEGDLALWPFMEQAQLRRFLAGADVLVYPSLADNHPLLILEAMAQRCPVVAHAVGGIPEQITHDRTGLLARPGDDAALVAAAAEVLLSPSKGRALAEEAWGRGRTHFCAARMVEDHIKLYAGLDAV